MKRCVLKSGVVRIHRHEVGFTLLELLISLTVLALFIPLIFGGFSFGSRVWDRTERAEKQQSLVMMRTFLKQQLHSAFPPVANNFYDATTKTFSGLEDELSFVAPLPQSTNIVGKAIYILKEEISEEGLKSLVVSWQPEFGALGILRNGRDLTEVTLIANIKRLSFRYFGSNGSSQPNAWKTIWSDEKRLPQLIQIMIEFPRDDKRRWQPLIIAPAITGAPLCEYDPVSRLCKVGSR